MINNRVVILDVPFFELIMLWFKIIFAAIPAISVLLILYFKYGVVFLAELHKLAGNL